MGIRGLATFVNFKQPNHLEDHQLSNTALVIDGANLERELYFEFLRKYGNDLPFGGDYPQFAAFITQFFQTLVDCEIKPIVIMDGSFKQNKFSKKIERFHERIEAGRKIYNCEVNDENRGIHPLFSVAVFCSVIKQLGLVHNYQCIYEADEVIPTIAGDLQCAVLSDDTDFCFQNLPNGVIPVYSLLNNFTLDGSTVGCRYLNCKLYRIDQLMRKFPGLKKELIPLSGAILGEHLSYEDTRDFVNQFPRIALNRNIREPARQIQIKRVFNWLSQKNSINDALEELKKFCRYDAGHSVLRYIADHSLNDFTSNLAVPIGLASPSVEDYFRNNICRLFQDNNIQLPVRVHQRFVQNQIQKRLISIYQERVEFFEPLIEDYSLNQSAYDCTFDLCGQIYGLLRNGNLSSQVVKRFVRCGPNPNDGDLVSPKSCATSYPSQVLPSLDELVNSSESDRIQLFGIILGFESNLINQIQTFVTTANNNSKQHLTGMISLIYFCRHIQLDVWIEFVYALLANIQLVLIEVPKPELDQFRRIPSFSKFSYVPRIVHQYNGFQACLQSICFLAEILDLSHHFNADQLIMKLQGSFIYNLTVELVKQDKPLRHLEHNLLNVDSQKDLDFVLSNCQRTFTNRNVGQMANRDVVPLSLINNQSGTSLMFFVRGKI